METFTPPRPMITFAGFDTGREKALEDLTSVIRNGEIDPPLLPLIRAFSRVPSCYTLQSCYGHFVHAGTQDIHTIRRLQPGATQVRRVTYRIAYVAFCIENSRRGHLLCEDLRVIARNDPEYIQFGSADWFWDQTPNTYAIQVSPSRYQTQDSCLLTLDEALVVQDVRDRLFTELMRLVKEHTPAGR
ncbi:hypothetical protein AZH53_11075 [Methanomicrobiaceae archaeon CYW5]|uniref:hypothetical protein n=1 Tax=Methanovulcanius yangii TaxID=1789227 RepID=UPI0029CA26C9|nr:hypothetical protein [Methanovulcanius yangii]MBT8506843.1 hypothetical protein [Methanovulcanius yangii]MBT8508930.1 hypothetical protein [Methanovulcanius yangii]MBT8508944.1 hypothetical protein [Methanovulcanius yangii]